MNLKKLASSLVKIGTNNKSSRITWVEKTLKKMEPGGEILDAGAGEQQFKKFCTHLKYVSQDFAEYDGSGNTEGLQTIKWDYGDLDIISDITDIPVEDGSFDVVMCTEVLEHVADPQRVLEELTRVLKPNGHLILTAPFCSLTHFAPYHFYSGFNRYFYEEWLKKYNYEILEMESNGNFFEYIAQEILRIPNVVKQYNKSKTSYLQLLLIFLMVKMLEKLSIKDGGSNELLCFGYHVLARKKGLNSTSQ